MVSSVVFLLFNHSPQHKVFWFVQNHQKDEEKQHIFTFVKPRQETVWISLWLHFGIFFFVCRMRLCHTTQRRLRATSRVMSCFGKDRLWADMSPTHLALLPWISKVTSPARVYRCWSSCLCSSLITLSGSVLLFIFLKCIHISFIQ